jgi:arabinose-5-phosphate isomerase
MAVAELSSVLKSAANQQDTDLDIARSVLRLESDALNDMASVLDENFSKTLDIIQSLKGRLIVTGMGKAGHVGKKVTATFASTGTPSYFVHPAEASHGDLGMVSEHDAVIALSKSGETKELSDIVNYCKRFSIPLIAITCNRKSTLALNADLVIWMGPSPEACPNQQAPTTSTTLMIAIGDALAIAMMKRRGFSANDFRTYHPGGKLGGQLLTVQSIMKQGDVLPLVSHTATMQTTQQVMSDGNFGCAIVINDNRELAGFISDGDVRRNLSPTLLQKPVTEVMGTSTPRTIEIDALAAAALAIMNQHNITQLVVVDGKTPVGLLRLHDIMRAGVA